MVKWVRVVKPSVTNFDLDYSCLVAVTAFRCLVIMYDLEDWGCRCRLQLCYVAVIEYRTKHRM